MQEKNPALTDQNQQSDTQKELKLREQQELSRKLKAIFTDAGLIVDKPSFIAENPYRPNGFAIRKTDDSSKNYEVDVWDKGIIFLKSIWPAKSQEFEEEVRVLLSRNGYTNIRFAETTH